MNKSRTKIGREITSYDECEIIDSETEYRFSHLEDFPHLEEGVTEEEVREDVLEDADIFTMRFKEMCETLGDHFSRKFPTLCAKVVAENLNWRGSNGHKYICLDHLSNKGNEEIGEELVRSLISGDYTLHCYNYNKGLFLRISHHDCPTGSRFYLTPCAYSTYERHNK